MADKNSLRLAELQEIVAGGAAAIRSRVRLLPAGGREDKVFPPTYSGGKYAFEKRRIEGRDVDCVLLDSVQSQANRFEEALLNAIEEGEIKLPLLTVAFSKEFKDLGRDGKITALDAPHRIADAILRDSSLKGQPFRESPEGHAYSDASIRNATIVFELCPTALVFGTWDSTGPRGGLGNKIPRAIVSEIVAIDISTGVRTSSRIDPLGIVGVPIFKAKDAKKNWVGYTAELKQAELDTNGNPVLFSREGKKGKKGKPSEVNHGNVTPDTNEVGGVTMGHALQTTVVSLPTLRRLRFPDAEGNTTPERNKAARTVLAALALAAVAYQRERAGYNLRSRCDLVPAEELPPFEVVEAGKTDADKATKFELSAEAAAKLLEEAVGAAKKDGVTWRAGEITLEPSAGLVELVKASRAAVAAGEAEPGEGEVGE